MKEYSLRNVDVQVNAIEPLEVYHIGKEYFVEFKNDDMCFRICKSKKWQLEEVLGKAGVQFINYHSSNGSVTPKEVHKEEVFDNYFRYDYKKVK